MTAAKRAQSKSANAFRSIGEAAEELGLPTHVLRFWETKFSVLNPVKRKDGRRMFRPQDVDAAKAIQSLLHDQGMTIKGAQKLLKAQGVEQVLNGGVRIGQPLREVINPDEFTSPAANPVQRLQKTVNDVVESGVFSDTETSSKDRLTHLLDELDSVKSRLDAVLVKDAA
ncbi:MAG: hypothetical protein CMK07_02335 [Ponticaulis sp.]|nr:hypothetical protein [Ponticaulis sp.]